MSPVLKVLVVADFGLNERTGGYSRNLEVLRRLSKRVELVVFPSTRNLALSSRTEKQLRDTLDQVGGEVHELAEPLIGEEFDSREEVLSRIPRREENYDVIYVYGNSWPELEIARRLRGKAPVGVQLQLEPFYREVSTLLRIKLRGPTCTALPRLKRALLESEEERRGWLRAIAEGGLNFILSVSSTPLKFSGLDSLTSWEVIRPANAFNGVPNYDKEDYAIYFTRLIPEKGVFEVPLIWREVNRRRDLKLYVVGKFQYREDEEAFLKMSERFKVNLEYLGFKEGKELFDLISKARVTVYPSHYDSFSMVVLESLSLGTPVVAYGTPAIREVYSRLPEVRVVREDEIKEMAREVVSILGKEKVGTSHKTQEFLREHSSWEKVVEAELKLLRRFSINRGVNP
jgi:Glycosyltransferase